MEQRKPKFNREDWQLESLAARAGTNTPARVELTTNWPDMGTPARKKRPGPVYFIDSNGITVGTAKSKAKAKEIARLFPNTVVRLYHPTAESMEEENRVQRDLYRHNIKVRRLVV